MPLINGRHWWDISKGLMQVFVRCEKGIRITNDIAAPVNDNDAFAALLGASNRFAIVYLFETIV